MSVLTVSETISSPAMVELVPGAADVSDPEHGGRNGEEDRGQLTPPDLRASGFRPKASTRRATPRASSSIMRNNGGLI